MVLSKKRINFISSVMAFLLFFIGTTIVMGQNAAIEEIERKLLNISEEEKQVLDELFMLYQEIESLEREGEELKEEIEAIRGNIKELEKSIEREKIIFNEKRDVLKSVLKTYQRMGPGTYIEILFEAENLADFLRRLNVLRDLARNNEILLQSIEESKNRLEEKRNELSKRIDSLEEKERLLAVNIENMKTLTEEREKYLASLADKRDYYQRQMGNIEKMWKDLKPFFQNMLKEFSKVMEMGNLPEDGVKISISLSGVKGTIDEDTFNNIIKENFSLPEMRFAFYPGEVEISIPDKHLVLKGKFNVIDGHALKFIVSEGEFWGLSLSQSSLDELFQEDIILDLKPLIGSNKINSIEIKEKLIEMAIKLNLF